MLSFRMSSGCRTLSSSFLLVSSRTKTFHWRGGVSARTEWVLKVIQTYLALGGRAYDI
jgi:hypothetical protein